MRSLTGTLTAAQKAASGVPYVRTVVSNAIRGLRHHVFTQTQFDAGSPDSEQDAAGDTTYIHACAVNPSLVKLYYRRHPSATWTEMAAATIVHAAIAAVNNTRVILVYNRGLNIYFRESTDQGSTFGVETLIVASTGTVNAIAVAYNNNTGDLAVFWADNVTLKRIRRTAGAFGAATSSTSTFNSINGVAACWNGDFLLAITGVEITTLRPTVWSHILGDGFAFTVDTWTAFFIQAQAESDETITYQAPSVALLDTMRITFVEKFTGSPAYTRTYWSSIALTASFSPGNWEWMDPAPINNALNNGYAVAKGMTPQVAVYLRDGQTLEAPTAAVTLDMSPDLIEATIDERDGLTQRGEFVFDNSNGQYAGPPAPIALHYTLDIGIGYGTEYSRPPSQTIIGWQYRRSGGRSQFVLHTAGADDWLALSRSRTTIVDTRKMTQLARAAAARAGLDFISTGASSRATNFNIEWVVNPQQTQLDVLRALATIMPDIFLTFSTGTLMITAPLAGDSADYTYGTDHAIYASQWADEPNASVAEIAAVGVLGSAYDYTELNHDKPIQDRRRSPHETVAADADANATARLRKAVLARDMGELVTPPNCGLEIADVITWTDSAVAGSALTARVAAIKTTMRRHPSTGRATYEQRVTLAGV